MIERLKNYFNNLYGYELIKNIEFRTDMKGYRFLLAEFNLYGEKKLLKVEIEDDNSYTIKSTIEKVLEKNKNNR